MADEGKAGGGMKRIPSSSTISSDGDSAFELDIPDSEVADLQFTNGRQASLEEKLALLHQQTEGSDELVDPNEVEIDEKETGEEEPQKPEKIGMAEVSKSFQSHRKHRESNMSVIKIVPKATTPSKPTPKKDKKRQRGRKKQPTASQSEGGLRRTLLKTKKPPKKVTFDPLAKFVVLTWPDTPSQQSSAPNQSPSVRRIRSNHDTIASTISQTTVGPTETLMPQLVPHIYFVKTGISFFDFIKSCQTISTKNFVLRESAEDFWRNNDLKLEFESKKPVDNDDESDLGLKTKDVLEREKALQLAQSDVPDKRSDSEIFEDFLELSKSIQKVYEHGGMKEPLALNSDVGDINPDLVPGQGMPGEFPPMEDECYFPEKRKIIEEENFYLMKMILSYLPDYHDEKERINVDKYCTIFKRYVSLQYLVKMMTDLKFRSYFNGIFCHRFLDSGHPKFKENWSKGQVVIQELLKMLEGEGLLMSEVEDDPAGTIDLEGFTDSALNWFKQKILVLLESEEPTEEEALRFTFPGTLTEDYQSFQLYEDLIAGDHLKLARSTKIVRDSNGQETEIDTYYDINARHALFGPSPIVVPRHWAIINLRIFLLRPQHMWNRVKTEFLRQYFDILNLGMINSLMNNNDKMLQMFLKYSPPESFKPRLQQYTSYAASLEGTVQIPFYQVEKGKKKFILVNSGSYFLPPLVRADLYFSYSRHCLFSQVCNGHTGHLLCLMIRMRNFPFAKALIKGGVKINSRCCKLSPKKIQWIKEISPLQARRKDGPPQADHARKGPLTRLAKAGESAQKNPEVVELKAYIQLRETYQLASEQSGVPFSKGQNDYWDRLGFFNDDRVYVRSKRRKETPLSCALEVLFASNCRGEKVDAKSELDLLSFVEFLFQEGARAFNCDAIAVRSCLPFLRQVAELLNDDEMRLPPQKARSTKALVRENWNKVASMVSNKSVSGVPPRLDSKEERERLKRNLLGLRLSDKFIATLLAWDNNGRQAKWHSQIRCFNLVIENAKKEIMEDQLKPSKRKEDKLSMVEREQLAEKQAIGMIRVLLLHWSLIAEEWSVAKLLTNFFHKSEFNRYSISRSVARGLGVGTTAPDPLREMLDPATAQYLALAVKVLINSLGRSRITYVHNILNGLNFLHKDMGLIFEITDYDDIFSALFKGLLNMPYALPGILKPIQLFFMSDQVKHVLGAEKKPALEVRLISRYLPNPKDWADQLLDEKKAWQLEMRKLLTTQLMALGAAQVTRKFITPDFFLTKSWSKVLLSVLTMNNYSVASLPFVFDLFKNNAETDSKLKAEKYAALESSLFVPGLTLAIFEGGYMPPKEELRNFLLTILVTQHKKFSHVDVDFVADLSPIFMLAYFVDYIVKNEVELGLKSDKLFQWVFDKLEECNQCWLSGVAYILEEVPFQKHSARRSSFQGHIYDNLTWSWSVDKVKHSIKLVNMHKLRHDAATWDMRMLADESASEML